MKPNFINYHSNRSQKNLMPGEERINYDEMLKSRNEIIKQCRNQNLNISDFGDSMGDNFQYLPQKRAMSNTSMSQKARKNQMINRKSTTNLIPARSKKPKFILKKNNKAPK